MPYEILYLVVHARTERFFIGAFVCVFNPQLP